MKKEKEESISIINFNDNNQILYTYLDAIIIQTLEINNCNGYLYLNFDSI